MSHIHILMSQKCILMSHLDNTEKERREIEREREKERETVRKRERETVRKRER